MYITTNKLCKEHEAILFASFHILFSTERKMPSEYTHLVSLDLVFFESRNILRIRVCQPRKNNMNIVIKFTIAATCKHIFDSITQPPASHCREFCSKT